MERVTFDRMSKAGRARVICAARNAGEIKSTCDDFSRKKASLSGKLAYGMFCIPTSRRNCNERSLRTLRNRF